MILDNLGLAFGGIIANKVRSFLTMLSVGIGVFAVITLMAVAAGATQTAQRQLSGLGSPRLINVYGGGDGGYYPGDFGGEVFAEGAGDGELDAFDLFDPKATPYVAPPPAPLTVEDVALLNDGVTAPDVSAAAGLYQSYGALTTEAGGYVDTELNGTNSYYAQVSGLTVQQGTFIMASDVANRARVLVLSETAALNLGASVGTTATVQSVGYEVIGVVDDVYPGNPSSFLPETTIQDTMMGPQTGYQTLYVLANDDKSVESAADQVRDTLRTSHLLGPTDAADFTLYTRTDELKILRAVTIIFQALAGAIASIALFVAGIGVMNIMLVTVTERTREIGIRKAIGAQHHHLLGQFLLEATVLTFTGGLVGVLLGSLTQLISIRGFSPVVTPFSVILALSFSIATGLFFGLYPANRAASMPPIQALRYE